MEVRSPQIHKIQCCWKVTSTHWQDCNDPEHIMPHRLLLKHFRLANVRKEDLKTGVASGCFWSQVLFWCFPWMDADDSAALKDPVPLIHVRRNIMDIRGLHMTSLSTNSRPNLRTTNPYTSQNDVNPLALATCLQHTVRSPPLSHDLCLAMACKAHHPRLAALALGAGLADDQLLQGRRMGRAGARGSGCGWRG